MTDAKYGPGFVKAVALIRTGDMDLIIRQLGEDMVADAIAVAYHATAHGDPTSPRDAALLAVEALPDGEQWEKLYADMVTALSVLPE